MTLNTGFALNGSIHGRLVESEGGGATSEFIPLWGNLGADPMITMSSFEEIRSRHKCQRAGGQRTQCDANPCIIRELYCKPDLILQKQREVNKV